MNGRNLTPPSFSLDSTAVAPAAPAAAVDEKADLAAAADSAAGVAAAAPADSESAAEAPLEAAVTEIGAQSGEVSTAPDATPVESDTVAIDSAEAGAAIAEPVESAEPAVADASVAEASVAKVAASEPAEPESAVTEQQATPAQPVAAPETLELGFTEESWIEVKDATGKLLMAKLQPAGAELTLEGQAPFSVMLGNAVGTEVRYRGELVDSAPIGGRRTRRLTVGE